MRFGIPLQQRVRVADGDIAAIHITESLINVLSIFQRPLVDVGVFTLPIFYQKAVCSTAELPNILSKIEYII